MKGKINCSIVSHITSGWDYDDPVGTEHREKSHFVIFRVHTLHFVLLLPFSRPADWLCIYSLLILLLLLMLYSMLTHCCAWEYVKVLIVEIVMPSLVKVRWAWSTGQNFSRVSVSSSRRVTVILRILPGTRTSLWGLYAGRKIFGVQQPKLPFAIINEMLKGNVIPNHYWLDLSISKAWGCRHAKSCSCCCCWSVCLSLVVWWRRTVIRSILVSHFHCSFSTCSSDAIHRGFCKSTMIPDKESIKSLGQGLEDRSRRHKHSVTGHWEGSRANFEFSR